MALVEGSFLPSFDNPYKSYFLVTFVIFWLYFVQDTALTVCALIDLDFNVWVQVQLCFLVIKKNAR